LETGPENYEARALFKNGVRLIEGCDIFKRVGIWKGERGDAFIKRMYKRAVSQTARSKH
jgi:hypothetical protein